MQADIFYYVCPFAFFRLRVKALLWRDDGGALSRLD